ncbi:hypothetical protein [Photobacterium arenosum]|nr:hypothetical protein [Photobacterium arenosum]
MLGTLVFLGRATRTTFGITRPIRQHDVGQITMTTQAPFVV